MSDGSAHFGFPCPGQIARLVPRDRLARDDDQRLRLFSARSEGSPSIVMARAREELAHHLAMAARAMADCAFAEVERSARRLRRIGLDLGFPSLAAAADNVLDCLTGADAAAIAATMARLYRLGGLALQDLAE